MAYVPGLRFIQHSSLTHEFILHPAFSHVLHFFIFSFFQLLSLIFLRSPENFCRAAAPKCSYSAITLGHLLPPAADAADVVLSLEQEQSLAILEDAAKKKYIGGSVE